MMRSLRMRPARDRWGFTPTESSTFTRDRDYWAPLLLHSCRRLLNSKYLRTQQPPISSRPSGTDRFATDPCTSSIGSPLLNSSSAQKEPLQAMTLPDRSTNLTTAARWPTCLVDVCVALQMNPIGLSCNCFDGPSLPPPGRDSATRSLARRSTQLGFRNLWP